MQKVDLPTSFTKLNENCGLPDFFTDYQILHLCNPSGLPGILLKIDPCIQQTSFINENTNKFVTVATQSNNKMYVNSNRKIFTIKICEISKLNPTSLPRMNLPNPGWSRHRGSHTPELVWCVGARVCICWFVGKNIYTCPSPSLHRSQTSNHHKTF